MWRPFYERLFKEAQWDENKKAFWIDESFFDHPMFVNGLETPEGKEAVKVIAQHLAEEIDKQLVNRYRALYETEYQ